MQDFANNAPTEYRFCEKVLIVSMMTEYQNYKQYEGVAYDTRIMPFLDLFRESYWMYNVLKCIKHNDRLNRIQNTSFYVFLLHCWYLHSRNKILIDRKQMIIKVKSTPKIVCFDVFTMYTSFIHSVSMMEKTKAITSTPSVT